MRRSKMKRTFANKGLYVGAGIGISLFALVGILSGLAIGGVIGLKLAGLLFGIPVKFTLFARILIAVSMIAGVIGAAAVFILGAAITGWIAGSVADSIHSEKAETVEDLQDVKA